MENGFRGFDFFTLRARCPTIVDGGHSLDELGKITGLSGHRFSVLFGEAKGHSPHGYPSSITILISFCPSCGWSIS